MEALRNILDEVSIALAPLVDAARDPQKACALLADLGWRPDSIPQPFLALSQAGAELTDLLSSGLEVAPATRVLAAIKRLTSAINSIASQPDSAFSSGIDIAAFKKTIARDLLDYIVVEHLMRNRHQVGAVLKLAGFLRLDYKSADGLRQAYLKREVAWNHLGELITNPVQGFQETFDWSSASPKLAQVIGDVIGLFDSYHLSLSYFEPSGNLLAFINSGASVPIDEPLGVQLSFDSSIGMPEGTSAGVQLSILPAAAGRPSAIAILPYAQLDGVKEIPLSDTLSLSVKGSPDFSRGVAIIVPPGAPLETKADFLGGLATNPPELAIGVTFKPVVGESELCLLGSEDSSRFAIRGAGIEIGCRLEAQGKLDVFAELKLNQARAIVKPEPDDADSFLTMLLPEEGISTEFSLAVRLSNLTGFSFSGSGGLEMGFPLHVTIGPIEVQTVSLGVKPKTQGVDLETGVTISGKLGPLALAIERVGFKIETQFLDPPSGNLGPVDMAFAFKPPNGVGLAIDAGVIKGGGYLYFDYDKEEYAGALELAFAEFLTLKAIGLITTRMPDGSKGFSLLIIITAEFGSPIQLSFGFTLSGVGGLLGLNRTMMLQPLAEGVRTGAVNSVMFPTNVVANAPRIISDLRSFFPPHEGIFLIGPMAKIGWGTPNLVTLSLGIIIEIPGNIAILGVLKVALPDEQADLLRLQVNFIGAIEFDKKRIWFYASMFDSRVLWMTLEGQMGVFLAWGDDPNFVISVGGFHPAFNPPPLPFPEPNRICISILNESWARVRVDGYFAVTSNTVQFGARAELYFGVSAFNIDGQLTFDALFRFSPFYFSIGISASLSVKVFGIGLFSVRMRGSLEGPTPWHVEGTGSISLLFFDIDVDFSHTWGQESDTTLPPIEVIPLLKAEFEKAENWKAEIPAANTLSVSLRTIESTEGLILHPVGTLRVSQRAVPLELTIDKMGAQKPSDANHFTLSIDTDDTNPVGTETAETNPADEMSAMSVIGPAYEMFAMAQFKDMSDSSKLNAPSFEKWKGGVRLSVKGEQFNSTCAVKRVVRYEQVIIDSNFKRFVKHFATFPHSLFNLFLKGNAVTKSALSNAQKKQRMPFENKISITPNLFVVASNTDNSPLDQSAAGFTSYAEAEQFLSQKVGENPNLKDSLHVIPQSETRMAA